MEERLKHNGKIDLTLHDFLINQLMQQKNLTDYFKILNCLKEKILVLIAVKDTPGFQLSTDEVIVLNEIGLAEHFEGKHWHSYIAAINCGKVLVEKISVNDENVEDVFMVGNHSVKLFSSIYKKENIANIIIDDIDYAINSRGFNIVAYDWSKEMVIDTVCFDKLVRHNCSVRKEELMAAQVKKLENELRLTNERIANFESNFLVQMEKIQLMLWQCYRSEGEELTASKERFFLSLPKAFGELRNLQLAGLILLVKFDDVCRKNEVQYWLSFGGLLGAIRHHNCIPWDDDLDVAMMRDEFEKIKEVFSNDRDFYIRERVCVSLDNLNHCYQLQYKLYDAVFSLDIFIYDYAVEINEIVIRQQIELNREIAREGRTIAKTLGFNISKADLLFEYSSAPPELIKCIENFNKRAFERYGKTKDNAVGMVWSIENFRYTPAVKTNKNLDEVFPLCEVELEGHTFLAPQNAFEYVNDMYDDIFSIPNDIKSHRHFKLDSRQRKILDEVLERYMYILMGDQL